MIRSFNKGMFLTLSASIQTWVWRSYLGPHKGKVVHLISQSSFCSPKGQSRAPRVSKLLLASSTWAATYIAPLGKPVTSYRTFSSPDSKRESHLIAGSEVQFQRWGNREVNVRGSSFLSRISWLLGWIWECIATCCRALRLLATFGPLIITFPLCYLNPQLEISWRSALVSALEFSGPIFIKLGQWASTRRDLFSTSLCQSLSKLQRATKPHSWLFTLKQFEYAYGPHWHSLVVRVENNYEPIGSGCCAQVYKAWIRPSFTLSQESSYTPRSQTWLSWWEFLEALSITRWLTKPELFPENEHDTTEAVPVAMKVVHPGIQQMFLRDLRILTWGAILLSTLIPPLRWLDPVTCVLEFSELMLAQIDMRVEAAHTERFRRNFDTVPNIVFPRPINALVTPHILVETYETGMPMDRILQEDDRSVAGLHLKQELAQMGVDLLLKMVFQDNFVHGDLHPGNLMVKRLSRPSNSPSEFVFPDFAALTLGDDVFHHRVTEISAAEPEVQLIVIDCGIVASLRNELLVKRFRQTFKAIVLGHGEEVADLFLETSYHKCSDVAEFKRGMAAIVNKARADTLSLSKIDVAELMKQLFQLLLEHRVRLESQFSTVILAVLVLEGLGRSLDPQLDLLQRAIPFLL